MYGQNLNDPFNWLVLFSTLRNSFFHKPTKPQRTNATHPEDREVGGEHKGVVGSGSLNVPYPAGERNPDSPSRKGPSGARVRLLTPAFLVAANDPSVIFSLWLEKRGCVAEKFNLPGWR
ncbi:hypothetical protein CEXT_42261 [Caerostris extrusa]|uniref:Uncharacterized protein n=1 Tax=Caerostris extrusa TaxID=172846 RepID=A0AAV4PRV4_CAEEX|nr:hypothetical protein CEXT_42261 [Caerostris extrusa]